MSESVAISPISSVNGSNNRRKLLWLCVLLLACIVTSSNAVADDESVRAEKIASLSAEQKRDLQNKWDRFQELDPAEQDHLRELHSQISEHEDSERLVGVLQRYHEWLKTLSASKRAELLQMPAADRLAEIKRIKQETADQNFRRSFGQEIRMEDVGKWIDSLVKDREAEWISKLPEDRRQALEQIPDETARRRYLLMSNAGRSGQLLMSLKPTEEELDRFVNSLPPNVKDRLNSEADLQQRTERVEDLVRAAMFMRRPPPEFAPEDLEKFFAELPQEDREMLERLPAERMQYELRRRYFQSMGFDRGRGGRPGRRFGPPFDFRSEDNGDRHRDPDGRRGGEGRRGGGGPRGGRPGPPDGFNGRPNGPPPEFSPDRPATRDFPDPTDELHPKDARKSGSTAGIYANMSCGTPVIALTILG